MAFKGERIETVATSTAKKCLAPSFLDYILSVIKAGERVCLFKFKPEHNGLLHKLNQ